MRSTAITSFDPKRHGYPFDPAYGHDLDALTGVRAGPEPEGFEAFWRQRYGEALALETRPEIRDDGRFSSGHRRFDITYRSLGGVSIGGWLLLPESGSPWRALVVTHGYGGREAPDDWLAWADFALLFPCLRGFNRSQVTGVPDEAYGHVVHGIDDPHRYVLGGCVADVWCGVSALLRLFPKLFGHVGYAGTSFGGGIGALAVPWDERVQRAHFEVPTFGHQRLRVSLPSVGSGHAAGQAFHRDPERVGRTLDFFDAAIAARWLRVPTHFACALFDPAVAPPGQWAVYNEAPEPKQLYVQEAGHFEYPAQQQQAGELKAELTAFFADL
ncbi:MAG: acetylxylan esterase [Opitutales bacterium]